MAPNQKKWFKPVQVNLPSQEVHVTAHLSEDVLTAFFDDLNALKVSEKTIKLFKSRAQLTPQTRLVVNLKTIAGIYGEKLVVDNVTSDGVSECEADALYELSVLSAGALTQIVAQSLLNISERYLFVQVFGSVFYELKMLSRKEKKDEEGN